MFSHKYILFIDTETSGKPAHWEASPRESSKWPYIVQIAWQIHRPDGKLVRKNEFFIEATDYSIQKGAESIHGISEEMVNQMGVARKEALKVLYNDLRHYKPLIVGHFVTLDLHMIEAGFNRAGIRNIIHNYDSFCTMRATSEYMHFNNRQYPKLGELYQMLFRRRMENEHSASGDARAVAECFFELVRKGEVDEEVIRRQRKELKKDRKKNRKSGCGLSALSILLLILTLWLI